MDLSSILRVFSVALCGEKRNTIYHRERGEAQREYKGFSPPLSVYSLWPFVISVVKRNTL